MGRPASAARTTSCSTTSSLRSSVRCRNRPARLRSLWSRRTRPVSSPWPSGPHDQGAHAEPLSGRQDLAFDAAVEDGVGGLLGAEPREAAPLGHPLGLDDVGGGGLGGADRADLAAADQVGQRGEGLLDVGVGIGAVQLVEVDVVGPQPPQRVLDGGDDPAPRGPLVVRVLPGRAAELGGEHDVVPAALQRLADHLLGVAVGVGGVDEVDACVDRPMDDPGRVRGVVAHGRREHQRAEGVGADLDAGPAEGAVLHGISPLCWSARRGCRTVSGITFRNYTEELSVYASRGAAMTTDP